MKILFSASSFGFLRNFQSTIRLLAERGHQLHLIAERTDAIDGQKMVDTLRGGPSVDRSSSSFPRAVIGCGMRWAPACARRSITGATSTRAGTTRRSCAAAPRNRRRLLPWRSARCRSSARAPGCALLVRLFHAIDRVLPPPGEVTDVFRRIQPDLMLLTPLLYFRSHQVDHIRSARELGIKIDPRRRQLGSSDDEGTYSRSARPGARVERGAEARGHRTARRAGRTRARDRRPGLRPLVLDAAVGRSRGVLPSGRLDPGRRFLLYLCSSPFIAPHEVGFVRRWIAAIRASGDPRLRSVRPPGAAASAELAAVGETSTSRPSSTMWHSGRRRG